MSLRLTLALASLSVLAACENPVDAIGFERMLDQPRGKPYKASPLFADGRLMRSPPAGVVTREAGAVPRELTLGSDAQGYVQHIPLPLDRALLERGRDRYETVCAACHGLTGDGESVVARHMSLRKPPSLVDEPVRSFPPGRVFAVIGDGYGLMPAYRAVLAPAERWAVVAYLSALQLSARVELARLPPPARARAEEALR